MLVFTTNKTKHGQNRTQPSSETRPLSGVFSASVHSESRNHYKEVYMFWPLLATIVLLCFYLDGRVPLPALRRLPVVGFLGLGLEGLVLLLGHLHYGVLGLLQLGALLGGALPSPAHLNTSTVSNQPVKGVGCVSLLHGIFLRVLLITSILLMPPIPLPP